LDVFIATHVIIELHMAADLSHRLFHGVDHVLIFVDVYVIDWYL
jgi:hypothetical protein